MAKSGADHENHQVLLILDGNSVLHRAYYALPDWRNRSGEATAGVYGFLSMLMKAIEELKPTHLVIVFDSPHPTFRHLMYVGYQTNREKDRQVSEDIWGQVEKLKEVFSELKVPVFCLDGFEADDLAGTLATQATDEHVNGGHDMHVIIITGDKDYMQLVTDKVKLFMPTKGVTDGVIIDRDGVRAKLGVWPEQVIDYKALVGDSSDNYPGVPGIGPKTATKLLEDFTSFDGLMKILVSHPERSEGSSLDSSARSQNDVAEGTKKKLIEGYESGELSYRLATIKRDSPVTLEIAEAKLPEMTKMVETFKKMGYKSLIKRMTGEDIKVDDAQGNLFERIGQE